jgi:signal peptidase I
LNQVPVDAAGVVAPERPAAAAEPPADAPPGAGYARTETRTRPPRVIFPHLLDSARSTLMMIVLALFVLTFILQPFRIPSESMERTLLVGDFVLVNKSVFAPKGRWGWLLPYREPRRGDTVVFYFPLNPAEDVVKRVVGVPGDRIRLRDGIVFRNGQPAYEPYAVYESSWPDSFRDWFPNRGFNSPSIDTHWWMEMHGDVIDGQLLVPPGEYFVLGDNRNHSRDSRYWGFVPRNKIEGMPLLVYFSVREPSRTDPAEQNTVNSAAEANGRLGSGAATRLRAFARWHRVLHVIR